MSLTVIQSGDNNAYKVSVDSAGRIVGKCIIQSFEERAVELGDAYNLNTGDITLTSASASGVVYLKNNEKTNIIVNAFIYLLGNSTGGSGNGYITVIENPTGGTLLTATAGTPKNRNVGLHGRVFNVDWRIGSEGKTITGGSTLIDTLLSSPTGRNIVSVPISIPNGRSIGIKYTPQSGNTSQTCQFALAVYLDAFN